MLQKPQGTNHHAIIQYFMHFIYLQLRPLSINLMPLDCERQHREAQWYTWRFRSCCEGTMLTSAISCFPWCRCIPGLTPRGIQSRTHTSPPVSSSSLPVNLTDLGLDCGRRVLWGGNSYQSELNKRQFWLFLFFMPTINTATMLTRS